MLKLGADWLHVDVMDGHFVPNLTIGAPVVRSLSRRTPAFLDCHLMVSDPARWVPDFAAAGAHMFTFHLEALLGDEPPAANAAHPSVDALIMAVREADMYVGIAIKPATPVEALLPYCGSIDMALVMTVEPGFGGQKYTPAAAEKCRALREAHPSLLVQVDGGLAPETAPHAANCGANVIVAGSAVFGAAEPGAVIRALRTCIDELAQPVSA